MDAIDIIRAIIGIVLVMFLPGYVWSYVFFRKNEIDTIERIAISFGLSISLVPLTIFFLNRLFDIKITFKNVLTTIVALIIIPLVILYVKNKWLRR